MERSIRTTTILLASEARLTSFIAIAKGDVPSVALVSPGPRAHAGGARFGADLLVGLDVRIPDARAGDALAIRQHVEPDVRAGGFAADGIRRRSGGCRGEFRNRPITRAISISPISIRAFGVPGLGLKRGLSEDLVIAPYANALASMINPPAAVQNFARLAKAGGTGAYGFYEALDYTAGRVPEGQDCGIVPSVHGSPPGHVSGGICERAE